jgi:hypothetical protein
MFAVYLLFKIREPQLILKPNFKIFTKTIRNDLKWSTKKYALDPHELKLIDYLSQQTATNYITVDDLNQILNLTKLSKENQRQRRHIILKELNLKLFLITGIRETIVRVSSDKDKRVKSYVFVPEILALEDFKQLETSI